MSNSLRKRYVCTDPIIFEEMNEILKTFKNRKAPVSNEINMELFKYVSVTAITAKLRFINILNICWATYQIPDDCRKAIIPIFKKGSRKDCNNYRGISMLSSAYKIYTKITTRRLNTITELKRNMDFEGEDHVPIVSSQYYN
jgi:hypothetical protein